MLQTAVAWSPRGWLRWQVGGRSGRGGSLGSFQTAASPAGPGREAVGSAWIIRVPPEDCTLTFGREAGKGLGADAGAARGLA